MWAYIVNGSVRELTKINPEGRFPAAMEWVKCDKSVQEGDLYAGGKFSTPEPCTPSDDEQRQKRKAAYSIESDPLFMAWQADKVEAKKAAWLAKREEIEARFPIAGDAKE